jgi:hypothetical protein
MRTNDGSDNRLLINTGGGEYLQYFAKLDRALQTLSFWLSVWSGGALHAEQLVPYLGGLRASYRMLKSRFMFEVDDPLMVDFSESGFPHSYMLARLDVDRTEVGDAVLHQNNLNTEQLKRVFLDTLFKTGKPNPALLNAVAVAQYREHLGSGNTFDPRFHCGEIVEHRGAQDSVLYRIQWASFDSQINVPAFYGMVFECQHERVQHVHADLVRILRHESRAGKSIALLAHHIDTGTEFIRPKFLSRAIVGPLYFPRLSSDDSSWSTLFSKGSDEGGYVAEVTVDHTHASEVRTPSRLAVSFGVSASQTQVFAINSQDPLCYERGASEVERIALVPHELAQRITAGESEATRTILEQYRLVPFGQKGELL